MQTSVTASSAIFKHPRGADQPTSGGGVQGFIGDLLRGSVAGYQAATHATGTEVDKGSIYPFETVTTATGLLKNKTAGVKFVSRATGLLHTVSGFGMLILASNVSGTMRAPGDTAADLGKHVADLIDGKKTAQGWSLGWGVPLPAVAGQQEVAQSSVGSALDSLGMR